MNSFIADFTIIAGSTASDYNSSIIDLCWSWRRG